MSRRTSTRAVINLFDITAKQDGQYESSDMLAFCDLNRLDEQSITTVKFATLEDDGFLLDGSYQFMDENTDSNNIGYWSSSMSDESGTFLENPRIVREFSDNHSSAGITLNFDENYSLPRQIKVSLFDANDTVINEGVFKPSTYSYFCDLKAEDYRKIIL